jgi:hypothetical protein
VPANHVWFKMTNELSMQAALEGGRWTRRHMKVSLFLTSMSMNEDDGIIQEKFSKK